MDDSFRTVTVEQFLEALRNDGREETADELSYDFMLAALLKEIPMDKLLSMTLREFVRAVNLPRGKRGWNTMWGERVLYPNG